MEHEELKRFHKIEQLVPMIRIAIVLFVTLIIIELIPRDFSYYNTWPVFCIPLVLYLVLMNIKKISRHFSINTLVTEHLEMLVFLSLTLGLVYLTGGDLSRYKIIYLLPVIFYTLVFGKKWGYLISTVSTCAVILFYIISPVKHNIYLEADLVLVSTFFLFSWLIGSIVDLERSIRNQLSEAAVKDELTGLYNYRFFQEKLKEMIKNKKDTPGKIGLIILDMDNFKLYNEVLGHYKGDLLLQYVSSTITKFVEKDDFAARYGGDEFVVVVTAQDRSQVIKKAENIRKRINAFGNEILGTDWNLSASIGVALFPDHAIEMENLLQKADEALYKAKMTKGNRVQLYYSVFDRLSGKDKNQEILNTVKTLMSVIHAKDKFTYGHSERVLVYAQTICRELRLLPKEKITIEYGAFLHDIGKIEIEREILNKPEPLTEKEQELLNQHPIWSGEIIKQLKMDNVIANIIYHHERFDGKGFPFGLKGHDIPLGARIISVADAFDMIISDRPFQKGKTMDQGKQFLKEGKGSLFDPHLVDTFITVLDRYQSISEIVEWPRDLLRLVPAGYIPGNFLMGCHYVDFYCGEIHFNIKATSYLAAGLINNEKCLYLVDEKREKIFLEELYEYSYQGTKLKTVIRDNQVMRISKPENLLKYIKRKAKLEFETRKFMKNLMDNAYQEGFNSIRILLESSSLSLREEELITWEKTISRCVKDSEAVVICLFDIDEENLNLCQSLYSLHARPLADEEDSSADAEER